jgi:hypothetical protein
VAVKKSEPLGRGAVWLQSEATLAQWVRVLPAPVASAIPPNSQRQLTVTFSSQKVLKRSSHRLFDVLERDDVLREVSDYNPKTHVVVLIALADFHHVMQLPLIPTYEHCRRCAVLGKVDMLIVNYDSNHRKLVACEILESTIPVAMRKRH